jgi:S1-C subfamily serine protease
VIALVSAAVGGYRIGFMTRVASWVVMAVGIVLAARSLPPILRALEGSDEITLLLVAIGTLLAGAFLGQAIGLVLGSKLHLALPLGPARVADRAAGTVAGVVGVLVGLWLLLPTMADVPGWTAEQARTSVIAEAVHDAFPDPPDTLQALRQLVGEDQFPRVFDALDRTPDLGPPPASSGLTEAVSDRVVPSTVKVSGAACRRVQEGSGFVVAPDLVVTNAHVVAGEDTTTVQRSDGSTLDATAVAFDPNRDLAVLRVPGLERSPLSIGDTGPGGRGGVFGHPGGGPLEISAFQVGEEVNASGRDIYDRNRTEREVLILSSELRPGDSGGALVDPAGAVVGVAFAIAPDRPGVAYALTTDELRAVLSTNLANRVDTGPCLT